VPREAHPFEHGSRRSLRVEEARRSLPPNSRYALPLEHHNRWGTRPVRTPGSPLKRSTV
jgi:hypothetical protein